VVEALESRVLLADASVVKDIIPGPESSVFATGASVNGKLFFSAVDETNGLEPWVSDGTGPGTKLLKDINPSGSSDPGAFTAGNDVMFFLAFNGSTRQVWRSDGTSAGTIAVTNFSQSVNGPLRFFNGKLLFTDAASELWSTDKTGPVAAKKIGKVDVIDWLGESNGRTFFNGHDFDVSGKGTDLWATDGFTAAPVTEISQIGAAGFGDSAAAFNGKLWFAADAADDLNFRDRELYSSDGTSRGTVKIDANPNGSSGPEELTVTGGKLYFIANGGGALGYQIFQTSGGSATPVTSFANTHPSTFRDLTSFNNTLFFTSDLGGRRLLFKVSGNGVVQVGSDTGGPDGGHSQGFLTVSGSTLFFSGLDKNDKGRVFETDGTSITAVKGDYGFDPAGLVDVNGTLFYSASDDARGSELHMVEGGGVVPPDFSVNLKIVGETDGTVDGFLEEGDSVTFRAVPSDPAVKVKYKWDFEGNGRFADAGARPPAYLYQDNLPFGDTRKVRVKAFVGGVPVAEDSARVNVKDVAPKVKFDVPPAWSTWVPMTATIRVKDKGKLDKLTYEIDWGDGTKTGPLPIANDKPLTVTKVFVSQSTGSVNQIIARGYSEALSGKKERFVPIRTVTSILTTTGSAIKGLLIGGTSGNDRVQVQPRAAPQGDDDEQLVEVYLNGQSNGVFTLATDDIIQLHGGDGNDRLEIDPGIVTSVHLFGGLGNDTLFGGAGDDTLYGNQGRDKLYGRDGTNKIKQ
jgi:ELWxxDGT repeat protein